MDADGDRPDVELHSAHPLRPQSIVLQVQSVRHTLAGQILPDNEEVPHE